MIHYHDYGLSPEEYKNSDIKLIIPTFGTCLNPQCRAVDRLYKHGYRTRYAVLGCLALLIVICRLKCRHCKKTFTIMPSFLLKKFQYTAPSILSFLSQFFKHRHYRVYRQLIYFYRKRFLSNIKLVEMFFRSDGNSRIFPQNFNEKAMKLIELITEDGIENFCEKFSTRFGKHFMTRKFTN